MAGKVAVEAYFSVVRLDGQRFEPGASRIQRSTLVQ
jgi:hypothetical protein